MSFYADLHIHSKYSRATSRDCDLENLTYWGRKKGITVIGTGDFTHPAWIQEIKEKLVPAEPGLFKLKPELEKKITEKLPGSCQGVTRFMLSVEISTIYKKGDKVRKIHHLIYAPSIEKAEKINTALEKIGNIRSDGRPILGLDSRHLLEIVLQAGEDCYLVPAHIWTPWFAVLGSKSGFDDVAHCYADLADHVFAVETGLSSDPEMNWKVSHLDRYRLMSNSDAHSPQKLGREVNVFNTELDYYAMRKALQTGKGFGGTLEFFPEEGKYHMDGHSNCEVRLSPEESKKHQGLCPKCKKPLTLGVLYRVEELADRHTHHKPHDAADFHSVIPLPEVISEIMDSGVTSQTVNRQYDELVGKLGSELEILNKLPLDQIQKASSSIITEAIDRMRSGKVIREAGYDGEYGRIKLFQENELKKRGSLGILFDVDTFPSQSKKKSTDKKQEKEYFSGLGQKSTPSPASRPLAMSSLDPDQTKALEILEGPLLITAGPGSGKTRTLTHRIAHIIKEGHAKPEECLTITFTRRAAQEMKDRLQYLLPESWRFIPMTTFHGLGLQILQENRQTAGLPRGFRVASDTERISALAKKLELKESQCEKFLKQISLAKRTGERKPSAELDAALRCLLELRDTQGWLDFDDLLLDAVRLLEEDSGLRASYRQRFPFVSIDEYQDIDELQYRLIQLLVPANGNLCAIGDPDQAIYSFRGASVEFFLRFKKESPACGRITLNKNYRSGESIINASNQMIASSTLAENRTIEALLEDTGKIVIHHAASDKAEAEFVVHTIEKALGGTSFFSLDSERADGFADKNYSFSDFAVLYRTQAQAAALEEALQRSGIPFQRHGHERLSDHGIVQKYLAHMTRSGIKTDLLESLFEAKEFLKELDPFKIHEKLETIALRCHEKWDAFLSEIYLGEEMELWDSRADRLTLLTLHAAKGLEFPVVFITGCEEGLLPFCRLGQKPEVDDFFGLSQKNHLPPAFDKIAEERRLFYVGMTRAKDRLYLSHAEKRLMQGKLKDQEASRFLKDIEENLLERNISRFKKKPKKAQMELF